MYFIAMSRTPSLFENKPLAPPPSLIFIPAFRSQDLCNDRNAKFGCVVGRGGGMDFGCKWLKKFPIQLFVVIYIFLAFVTLF